MKVNICQPWKKGDLVQSKIKLIKELATLTAFSEQISDLLVDELFSHNIGVPFIAPYSRIYCDVEKYIDDTKEIMSQYGQGVFYTKDAKGKEIRRLSKEYKDHVAKNYYFPYHRRLDQLTTSLLAPSLIIVDCHSYDENLVLHNKSTSYLDIDIGFTSQYLSQALVDGVKKLFEDNGYSVSYNHPYAGTLIPNSIINKNIPNVYCLMIEINKRVYLPSPELFKKCKETIKKVLEYISTFKKYETLSTCGKNYDI